MAVKRTVGTDVWAEDSDVAAQEDRERGDHCQSMRVQVLHWVCEVCGMVHTSVVPDVCDCCGATALMQQRDLRWEIGARW